MCTPDRALFMNVLRPHSVQNSDSDSYSYAYEWSEIRRKSESGGSGNEMSCVYEYGRLSCRSEPLRA